VRLIDDLLDASRIGSGKLELRRQRVALAEVMQQALETSRPHVERAGHALTVSLPAEPVHLNADPIRLAQVFSNLIHNACKYTEGHGQIWVTAERHGAELVVRVKDTGIGMPPQHLPRVFEMFSQGDSGPERSQGGLGIGLAVVRGLVEMHGGSVAAHSAGSGQGSEFVVRLPAFPEEPVVQPSTAEAADARPATTPRRILVVDDRPDNAESLALLLRLGGNEVETAHDGAEALAVAERWRPDVVLLDLAMPKVDGYEVCRRIRERPWGRRTRLIAQTGRGCDDDHQRTGAAGFDGHLVKPVDITQLQKLLDHPFAHSSD
jgi:CheY-like chemotaxis protein/two-component sensor histidine kinase